MPAETLRRTVAWVLVAVAPIAAWLAGRVVVDNRLERWVGRDGAEAQHHEAFRRTFGSDEFVLVAISGPLFEPAALDLAVRCLGSLEAIPGVVRVQGLPAVYRDRFGGEDPEELRREMTSTPFYFDFLLSRDVRVAGLLVEVNPDTAPQARRALVAAVRRAVAPLEKAGFRVGLVGSTVLIAALDELSEREARRSFPLAVLGSLAVLAVLLRSVRAMAVAAAASGLAVVLTLGLVAGLGGTLSMLTAVLPALLWVLGLSYSVHILHRSMLHRRTLPVAEAVERGLEEAARGVAFSALTTAGGFASLGVASLRPVRELGVIGAAGIAVALLVSLTVTPLLARLVVLPPRHDAAARPHRRGVLGAIGRPWTVLAAAGGLAALAVASLPAIRLESNPLSFLPAHHAVARDYAWVGRELTGFYTAEVVVRTPAGWTEPAAWPVLDELAAGLANSPIVARVVTPLDLLRKLNQWDQGLDPAAYRLPARREDADRLVGGLDPVGRAVLHTLVSADGREVRLSVVVRDMDEGKFLALVAEARRRLEALPAPFTGVVTGQVLRLVDAQQDLVATQLRSLALATLAVFLAVWAGLRSWRLTLVAVPPNLVPVATTFGAMAWLRIPLDAATVMVASVSLGIAVDNTIHILLAYRRQRAAGLAAPDAAAAALGQVGPAVSDATLAACTGFGALCVSSFVPIRYFGLLALVMMSVALACHLRLTPALLALQGGRAGDSGGTA
ncbi:MAG TPA: MMPL family transporter [Thermoanaerobaculaceae bacterium]|nr:MMPL family transporter [Thermoanaerobaculaceae bacterium]HRS14828.1 MMPL family transporter [Thermoanaerobaculaceae bacterium]